jgi:hypothetical protein
MKDHAKKRIWCHGRSFSHAAPDKSSLEIELRRTAVRDKILRRAIFAQRTYMCRAGAFSLSPLAGREPERGVPIPFKF